MVIPGTQSHALVIQSKSLRHTVQVPMRRMAMAGVDPGSRAQELGDERHRRKGEAAAEPEEPKHLAQQKVPSAVNSRVPLGLWASVWAAHKIWLAREDGYDHWCQVCQEGGHLLKCDNVGCAVVQHVACSTQTDMSISPWVCEDCWMMIGLGKLRLEDIPTGTTGTKVQSCWEGSVRSDNSDESQEEGDTDAGTMQQLCHMQGGEQTRRKRDCKLSGVWSTGKWVQNELAMQGMVLSMHHGYVQVRFGGEVKNCRRQQLTLLPDGPGGKRTARDPPGGSMGSQQLHQGTVRHLQVMPTLGPALLVLGRRRPVLIWGHIAAEGTLRVTSSNDRHAE